MCRFFRFYFLDELFQWNGFSNLVPNSYHQACRLLQSGDIKRLRVDLSLFFTNLHWLYFVPCLPFQIYLFKARTQRLKYLWISRNCTNHNGQPTCQSIFERMLKYNYRGFNVVGELPPRVWSINCPPWKWLSEGKLQHRERTWSINFHKHYKALESLEALRDFENPQREIKKIYCPTWN